MHQVHRSQLASYASFITSITMLASVKLEQVMTHRRRPSSGGSVAGLKLIQRRVD